MSAATIRNDRLFILGCHLRISGVVGMVMPSDTRKGMLLTQRPSSWISDMNCDWTGWSAIIIKGTIPLRDTRREIHTAAP